MRLEHINTFGFVFSSEWIKRKENNKYEKRSMLSKQLKTNLRICLSGFNWRSSYVFVPKNKQPCFTPFSRSVTIALTKCDNWNRTDIKCEPRKGQKKSFRSRDIELFLSRDVFRCHNLYIIIYVFDNARCTSFYFTRASMTVEYGSKLHWKDIRRNG